MPRASARLQRKRSQGEATTSATSKRPRRNQQPSQPTIFPSVHSAVTSVDLSTSSMSFNNDLISRLADAVTQRLRQENQPSLTALQSADTPVMEIPATIPSTPPCLPSHSLPLLESAVQASHLATQPAVSQGEPSDPFISSSLSLDARVSEKIRAKIWNQEYVDFGSLLVNPIGQSRFQLTVSNAESGQLPSLRLEINHFRNHRRTTRILVIRVRILLTKPAYSRLRIFVSRKNDYSYIFSISLGIVPFDKNFNINETKN